MIVTPILFSGPMVRALLDFADPRWSYMLGVVHGDGHIAPRSISISVSYKEPEYAEHLCGAWRSLGYDPKLYRPKSAYRIDVHSSVLAEDFRLTKARGLWKIPPTVQVGHYFAGVIDTDGHVTKAPQRQVVITLKRSGNLGRLCDRLAASGLRCLPVRDRIAMFKGRDYPIEESRWSGIDQLDWISANVPLQHPRKAARLKAIAQEIAAIKADVPLWRRVADWLAAEPRDIDEIMREFGLTKRQADSVLGNIKINCDLEVIPPPRALTKYSVRGSDA